MKLQTVNNAATKITMNDSNEQQALEDKQFAERSEPPSITLDERGMVLDYSKACEEFFGYQRRDLVWHHVSRLFPQLTDVELVKKGRFNPLLVFLCRCGKIFQAKNMLGDLFSCNLSFVHLEYNGKLTLRLIVNPSGGTSIP